MRKMDIVEYMMSLHFLPESLRVTSIRYSKVWKKVIKLQGISPLLAKQGEDAPATRTLVPHTLMTQASTSFWGGNPPDDLDRSRVWPKRP